MAVTAIEARTHDLPATGKASPIVRLAIFRSMADAAPAWTAMQTADHVLTPFQRFAFLEAWQRHIGTCEGIEPFVVVAYDAENTPVLLLPLGARADNGVRTACFLGGKHATFNMPIWKRSRPLTANDLGSVITLLQKEAARPDLLSLDRQPLAWQGEMNAMSGLHSQPAINVCPLLNLKPGAEPADLVSNSFRRRLKGKERKLQTLPGYRYCVARTSAEISRIIDAFFAIKPVRMAEQNLPNVFANAGVREFVDAISHAENADDRVEIHALECDDEVIAIFAGMADGHRFSMMFNTYTTSENAKYSPGLILLRNIVDHYAGRDYRAIDLGIGADEYKRLFCKDDEPLVDGFIPLTGRGHFAALGLSSLSHAKRLVKQNPALMQMAQRLRNAIGR